MTVGIDSDGRPEHVSAKKKTALYLSETYMDTEVDCLWEILVPTVYRDTGKPIRTRFHKVWDEKVREIAGGLTILRPAKGYWESKEGTLFEERMIPVRIMCSVEEIEKIADLTAEYYDQLAVMYILISEKATIKHYD